MGQLGIAELPHTTTGKRKTYTGSPCLVDRLKNNKVEFVTCGKDFTIAILLASAFDQKTGMMSNEYNEVYSWGNNFCGQLGQPEVIEHTSTPSKIKAFDVLKDDILQVSCGS